MPKIFGRIVFIVATLVTFSTSAMAEDAPVMAPLPIGAAVTAPAIVVVDVQRILDTSLAAKSVQKQLESQRARFQTEIEAEENELRRAENELNKSREGLTPDVYSDREQQLRQRFLTVERHVQARRKALDQTMSDSMNTVHASLLEIVKEVVLEHHANLALIKQQVLWTDQALDATEEILGRLNTALPSVTVKMAPEDASEDTVK